ncbi:MAG: EVE domain-containing protein [Roseibacillus sp.]
MKYWLIKSEPHVYGIKQLKKEKKAEWDGVRNYQARNMMRDEMKIGDLVLYYHSNCDVLGVVGIARVASEPYPDHTQFHKSSKYYDEKSSEDNPRWILVDFEFVAEFAKAVSLPTMKEDEKLEGMVVLRKGNRLSITPVEGKHFRRVCKLGGWDPRKAS